MVQSWQVFIPIYFLLSNPLVKSLSLSEFYPYGAARGDQLLPINDDGSSGRVPISIPFPYFDKNYEALFVNTNGVISFETSVPHFTPNAFPVGGNRRYVAAFWADVDTRNGGSVWYAESTNNALLQRATNDVRTAFIDQPNFSANWILVATWEEVAFYGARGVYRNKRNTFQAVLITNGRHSFVIYNYNKIEWTTGTASGGNISGLGGTPAQAGFNAGDGVRYFNIPGSRTSKVLDLPRTTNVGSPGRWMFRIDEARIEGGGCNTGGFLSLWPRSAMMLGGTNVFISGPCYNLKTDKLVCRFNGKVATEGRILSPIRSVCTVPMMNETGRMSLELSTNSGKEFGFSGTFISVPIDRFSPRVHRAKLKSDSSSKPNHSGQSGSFDSGKDKKVKITWNTQVIGDQSSSVTVEMARYTVNEGKISFHDMKILIKDQKNNGEAEFLPSDGIEMTRGSQVK